MQTQHHSRNPAGIVKTKPIALRLMPSELTDAARIAAERNVSRSALAREAYLKGLPLVIATPPLQTA